MESPRPAIAALALLAIACGGAEPGAARAGHYVADKPPALFPLSTGNRWRYAGPAGEIDVVAKAAGPEGSGLVSLVSTGALDRQEALLSVGPFTFLLARREGKTETRFVPFALEGFAQPVREGTRLELHYTAVNDAGREAIDEVWRVRSTSATVEVPAGTFKGVTELERETPEGTWISDWAPGVGKLRELGPDGAIELIDWGRPAQPASCDAPPCRSQP